MFLVLGDAHTEMFALVVVGLESAYLCVWRVGRVTPRDTMLTVAESG